jgi:hypothetical protein
MGVTVLWAPPWFHSRVEQVRASKLIREGVPPSVYEYAQRSEEPIDLWIPDPPLPPVDQGDVVLHRENSTVKTIATVMARLEDEQLLEDLSENSASGEVGYLLRDLQEVEFDVDTDMIRAPVPLLPPDVVYLRSDSEDFGAEGGFARVLSQLSSRLERRRLYKLLEASESYDANLIRSLLTTAESVIEWIFDGISGGRVLRILGFLTLLLLFGIGVIAEIWCWLTTVGELFGFTSGTCVHLFSLAFIEPATELSFALTGFLFVGVTLVAVLMGQAGDQPAQTAELIISTDEETVEMRGDYSFPEGEIELYEGGEQLDDDWVTWTIIVRSADSLQANRTQKMTIEPPDGSYVIWNSLTGPAPTEGRAWHLSGDIHERNVDEFPDWLLGSEKGISWWIVADLEPRLAAFRAKLRRATGYAVSASVLGVIIQSYPWRVTVSENPWLGRLPMSQHFFYGVLAIVFTFVFIGMAWTSIGLLELIRRSRT